MKNYLLLIFSFIACTAFMPNSDYRDQYTGYYFCNESSQRFNLKPGQTSGSITDTLTIRVSKDVNDSILDIALHKTTYRVKLTGKTLSSYPNGSHHGGVFFSTDSISFTVSPSMAILNQYIGKKK